MPFIPLEASVTSNQNSSKNDVKRLGFTPLEDEESDSSTNGALKTVKAIGAVYPVLETAANLASQIVAMPVAGLSGLGAIATNAIGLTDTDPADVVGRASEALAYAPKTDLGEHLTKATMYPFEKLAEVGRYAGDNTLDATNSPLAATVVDTTINMLPMGIGAKPKGTLARAAEISELNKSIVEPQIIQPETIRTVDPVAHHAPEIKHFDNEAFIAENQAMPIEILRKKTTGELPGNLSNEQSYKAAVSELPVPTNEIISSINSERLGEALVESDARVLSDDFNALESVYGSQKPDDMNGSHEQVSDLLGSEIANSQILQADQLLPELNSFENNLKQEVVDSPENSNIGLNQIADSRSVMAAGENYVGLGIDNAKTSGILTEKPIRREDVLIPFMKALDTTMYESRVKGKSRLGFYIPKLEAVRIKNKSDLEVAAHEIAHLIDDRVPEVSQSWKVGPMAKTFANELKGVSYDNKKVYEGFAEFVRLKMTQPEQAIAKAPEFNKWFDDFTNRHEYGAAIKQAQEGMSSWYKQDALHRAQSKIGIQKDLNGSLDRFFDRFRQSTVDDLHGIYQMERKLTGKTSPLGAYETARNTRGAGAMIDGAIRLGAPIKNIDGSFGFNGKGLEKILDPVASDLEKFLMYAVGRSSRELMHQGREKLFTPAEINSMVALETPEFKTAFSEYQTFNKAVLDFAEAQGVVNSNVRKLFSRQQYLPFYRAGQPGAQGAAGGVTGNWSGIKKLTGGDENLRPILGNMIQNTSMLIEASLKNEARAKIVELATKKGGGQFMVRIEADSRPVKINREQVKQELLKASGIDATAAKIGMLDAEQVKVVEAIDQAIDQAPDFFEFMIHNQAPAGNVMAVLKDGKPEYYEIADPLLYRAVSSLNRPAQNWLVNILGWPKRIGQAAITFTPDFMVVNLARDTLMATVMSKAGFIPLVDSIRGMASRVSSDPIYQEFIANGGGFASQFRDETKFKSHLERFYTSKGINYKTVLDTPDKLMYGIETIADAIEMSSRLGEYKRMRAEGAHPRHAAYAAREISTDFAMKGDSRELGVLYDTIMFLRPAVVSWDRLARGLTHDENKAAIAAKAGTLALMSAGLYVVNRDNPEYQDLPDWDKDTSWHFFVPQNDGSTVHFRYPKVFEIGALGSIAERSIAKLMDDEPEYGDSVAGIIKNTFHLNLMPQVLVPLYEQATNRNGFTKSPIETPGMENLQPFLRAKPNTSQTMQALGMATRDLPEKYQVAPARAEALLRGYFGTWAMYGLMLSDQALFSDKLPTMRKDEMPVIRRLYSQEPAKHTKYETMFYDLLDESKRLHGTIRLLDKTDRSDMADDFADNPLSDRYSQLSHANKSLQDINKDMNEVRLSKVTRDEKRLRLDSLMRERNDLLKSAVMVDVDQQKVNGFTSIGELE